MKFTKFLAVVMALALCLSMIVACDNGNTPADSSAAPAGTSAEPAGTTAAPAGTSTEPAATSADPAETTTAAPETSTTPVDVDPATAEAKIGDTLYATLDDAFDAVQVGETVELLMDLTREIGVFPFCEGAFTFDGCGHKITANIFGAAFFTPLGGEILVKNLDIDYTETSESTGALGVISIPSDVKVTLENCNFTALKNNCLYVSGSKGELIVNSGKYIVDASNDVAYSNTLDLRGICTINGGEFRRDNATYNRALVRNEKNTELTINDGTFYTALGRLVFFNSNCASDARIVTINGGTFECGTTDTLPEGITVQAFFNVTNSKGGTININGGEFTVKSGVVADMFGISKNDTLINITGGTFNNGAGKLMSITGTGCVATIKGGKFINTEDTAMFEGVEGTIVIEAGEFSCASAADADAVKLYAGAAKVTDVAGIITVG